MKKFGRWKQKLVINRKMNEFIIIFNKMIPYITNKNHEPRMKL